MAYQNYLWDKMHKTVRKKDYKLIVLSIMFECAWLVPHKSNKYVKIENEPLHIKSFKICPQCFRFPNFHHISAGHEEKSTYISLFE